MVSTNYFYTHKYEDIDMTIERFINPDSPEFDGAIYNDHIAGNIEEYPNEAADKYAPEQRVYEVYVYCDEDTWVYELDSKNITTYYRARITPEDIDYIAEDYKIHYSNRHYWRFMEWSDTGETTIDLYIDTSPDFDEEEYLFATAPEGY